MEQRSIMVYKSNGWSLDNKHRQQQNNTQHKTFKHIITTTKTTTLEYPQIRIEHAVNESSHKDTLEIRVRMPHTRANIKFRKHIFLKEIYFQITKILFEIILFYISHIKTIYDSSVCNLLCR